jgi:hypothetical protein
VSPQDNGRDGTISQGSGGVRESSSGEAAITAAAEEKSAKQSQLLMSTKITGQIMFALDSRVSALGSNSLAGIFRQYWSNLCTRC